MTSYLITQCLQSDYVSPIGSQDPLPNLLHIGFDEAQRLMGENPAEGPVARFMSWAYGVPDEQLKIIHIRDWHDQEQESQKAHLEHFGVHCLANTPGAAFVFAEPPNQGKQAVTINSLSLNDFLETSLASELNIPDQAPVRIGIIGVWTEAKVGFLAYELRTRYPRAEIAVSSALTASSSRTQHFIALEHMKKILGIRIFHSVGEFADFLADKPVTLGDNSFSAAIDLQLTEPLAPDDEKLVRYLFRHSSSAVVRKLGGGFSGNAVLGTASNNAHGHAEANHVIKIGPRELIGRERTAFEMVESVLGNNAPRIADFAEIGERGAIKYRYASMGAAKALTFQKLYSEQKAPLEKIRQVLDIVFTDQLGRFHATAKAEKCNLLDYYLFAPQWADAVRKNIDALGVVADADGQLEVAPGVKIFDPARFYSETLVEIANRPPDRAPFSYVHGDLNGANIIIDGNENIWLIDFFHTHHGHALKDLIKLENDLLFIFTPIEDADDLKEALALSDLLLKVEDLAGELPPLDKTGLLRPQFVRAYETIRMLRSFYPAIVKTDRDPLQFFIAQLRYAIHTLSFYESSDLQKRWALYVASKAALRVRDSYKAAQRLRVDWFADDVTQPGRLGITILPGRKDRGRDLALDISSLKEEGVSDVVVLVTQDELGHYGVPNLLNAYQEAGFAALHLPILDQRSPLMEDALTAVEQIGGRLQEGKSVLVHCVGGLGRSGLIAACYLKAKGLDTAMALKKVRDARSVRAVETDTQEAFVSAFTGNRN